MGGNDGARIWMCFMGGERMKIQTANDLKKFLDSLSPEELEYPVYFDTEARTFEYHCAKIGYVSSINSPEDCIVFNEE